MDLTTMREWLDAREISAMELLQDYLKRIAALDGKISAYLHVDEENAHKMATAAQKRIDGGVVFPLTGIPIGLKDNLCTADMPTTCASKMLENYTPPYDATVVARLRAQNAVFTGKLNMDEFAMGATTKSSHYKKTRNPFDENRVPGGSSGGSAAAVSAGLCAASLGSDTGGSVRQPASFCGVTGHRPTYGLVPRYGCVAFASSLDQVGPIATSAKDCALVLNAILGADPHDATCRGGKAVDITNFGQSLKGKRLGLIAELMGGEVDDEVKESIEAAADWYRRAGAVVEEVSLPMLKHAVPAYYLISSAEASANLARFDGVRYGFRAENCGNFDELISQSRAQGFGREVKRRILLGSYALCSGYYDAYYKKAVYLTGVIKTQYAAAFEKFDALLSPVSPTVAFPFDKIPDDPAQMYIEDICTVSAALAGLPSLSTPCGYTAGGMPVGLMITGKRWDDEQILALADAFEKDFGRRSPEVAI